MTLYTPDEVINIMVDCETLGTKPGCKILSIGATVFDTELSNDGFYIRIDSTNQYRLTSDIATEDWWARQSPEARQEAFSGRESIHLALASFIAWIAEQRSKAKHLRIWANGAIFDPPVLEAAMEAYNLRCPWKYYEVACYRTLKELGINLGIDPEPFDGTKHNALHDAINQAKHAEQILRVLRMQVR